jgi:N-formylmaleamate deformylase
MTHLFFATPFRSLLMAVLCFLLAEDSISTAQPLAGSSVQTAVDAAAHTPPSFSVQKTGTGKPMIFIPGLDCSGQVWKDAVRHFSQHFTCYTLTLPGFAGQPPIQSDSILQTIADQLAAYIREEHLDKPIIVGHSLGGWMALDFAIRYPDLPGDLVIVSSAPFLPALSMGPGITVDSAAAIGRIIKKSMAGQNPAQVRKSSAYYLSTLMRDSSRIAEVLEMTVQSDQPTQGEVMYELFSQDLRPKVGRIKSRILALADWAAYKQYGATRENVNINLHDQYRNVSRLTIAMNDSSRHFIMFDVPDWFYSQVDNFIASPK